LFIASRHPLGREQLVHRRRTPAAHLGGDSIGVSVIFAEDIVLAKLPGHQRGGGVSERQWNDLVNVASVQEDRLDRPYLDNQAARLGAGDLLMRLLTQQ
jgi:hypothetical protein